MTTSRILFCATLAAGAMLFAGCQSTPHYDARAFDPVPILTTVTNPPDAALLQPGNDLYTLGPGDVVEVELVGDPASRARLVVGPDGRVYYNLLPGVAIWGLTLAEARTKLETELKKIITQPVVNVALLGASSKSVWLLGQFSRPGLYPLAGPMRLLDAIGLAGGTAPAQSTVSSNKIADLQHSFVMRQGNLLPVDFHALLLGGDMRQNIYLKPDDFVYVPSAAAEEVYVIGGVRYPHPVRYHEGQTLISAMSMAGGAVPESYDTHVAIVRGSLTQPVVAVVNYRAIAQGRAADFPLESRDIIYVPWQPWRDLTRLLFSVTSTFVSTTAANAGAYWVNPDLAPVGISVTPGSVSSGGGTGSGGTSTGGASTGGGGGGGGSP